MKVSSIDEKAWKIEFIYSPLFEMLCSIHVLINPEHHLERIIWAGGMRAKLPDKLYEELTEFDKLTCEWCAIMDLCNMYEECDDFNIISALNFIEDMSINDFNNIFLKYQHYGEIEFHEGSKQAMVRMLKEYYFNYFEKELRFIEPLLVRCLRRDAEACSTKGILNYVNELHGRIEVTEAAFLFHKYTLFTVPFNSLKKIIIRVSSFINPHLLMDYGEDMVQFTTIAHLDKEIDKVPMDLLRAMKALSDETRLKIIKKLYKGKASTQSLALELKLTEACISKHLKMLYDAELLYKERDGSYIYYYLNSFFIDRVPLNIYEYLEN